MNQKEVDVYFELAQKLNRMEPRRLKEHIDMHEESVVKCYIEPFENVDYKSLVKNNKECFDFVGSILNEIAVDALGVMDKCGLNKSDINAFLAIALNIVLEKDTNSLTFHRLKIYVLLKVMLEKKIVKPKMIIDNFYNIYCSGVVEKQMFYNRPIVKYKELISYLPELNDEETITALKLAIATEEPAYADVIFEGI